jgi:hypothetical protein
MKRTYKVRESFCSLELLFVAYTTKDKKSGV